MVRGAEIKPAARVAARKQDVWYVGCLYLDFMRMCRPAEMFSYVRRYRKSGEDPDVSGIDQVSDTWKQDNRQ
jgi:hypothetical protein